MQNNNNVEKTRKEKYIKNRVTKSKLQSIADSFKLFPSIPNTKVYLGV